TLVELLAVIVILAIISIIAVTSITRVIDNVRADTHLANARNVLDVGKLAYETGETLTDDVFYGQNGYSLRDLSDAGYLRDTIQSPTFFSWLEVDSSSYDMDNSVVVVYDNENPVRFTVNLSLGGSNFIFSEEPRGYDEIERKNLTDELKRQLNIRE